MTGGLFVLSTTKLKPGLSLFDSLSIVAGTTIGSGIFVVSAGIAREVHTPALLLLVWVAASLMSLTGALTVAELAAMMPSTGGHYIFLRESYGGMCAFLFGWTIITVVHTGSIAAVSVVFAKYLALLLPAIHSRWHLAFTTVTGEQLVAIALITALTLTNVRGLHAGRVTQNLFTVIKLAALGLIVPFALMVFPNRAALQANFGAWKNFVGRGELSIRILPAFGAAMIGAMFALGGSENLVALGSEVRRPGRSLPVALIVGAGLVILLYLSINLAYLAQLPMIGDPAARDAFARGIADAQSDRVAAAAMQVLWGSAGARLTSLLVMISAVGCLNGLVLGGGRVMYAMAHDRVFFRIACRLNDASVPGYALALQGFWGYALVLAGDFSDLLNYMGGAGSLFSVLGIAAVFVMRVKHPEALRPYRVWGYPWIPAIHLLGSLLIFIDLLIVKTRYSVLGLLIVSCAIPIYLRHQKRIVKSDGLSDSFLMPASLSTPAGTDTP